MDLAISCSISDRASVTNAVFAADADLMFEPARDERRLGVDRCMLG